MRCTAVWSAMRSGSFPRNTTALLLIEPHRHQPTAVVEAVVRREVLDVGLPGRDLLLGSVIEVVRMMRDMPLDVPHDVAPFHGVGRATLELDHLRQPTIVDPGGVERLARH